MKRRVQLLVILESALVFLASLFLPWAGNRALPCPHPGSAVCVLNLFANGGNTGWVSEFGGAAGLLALAMIAAAALELFGRAGTSRLPLPTASFALVFLSVMTATRLWNYTVYVGAYDHATASREVGMYLGLASAAVAFVWAVGPRALEPAPRVALVPAAGIALTCALLAAVLVQQLTLNVTHLAENLSPIAYAVSVNGGVVQAVACALACFLLPLWVRTSDRRQRLAFTAAIAVLTAAFLVPFRSVYSQWPWEFWLLLACAAALLALTLATAGGLRPAQRSGAEAAVVGAAIAFLVTLFLPWQAHCADSRCVTPTNGWSATGHAGVFTVLMLLGLLGYRRSFRELSVGAAVYVVAGGLATTSDSGLGYGAYLGFAAAAVLLSLAVRRLRPTLARLFPLVACLGFLAFVVAPMTRTHSLFEFQSPWTQSELAAAAIFVALRLFVRWSDRPKDSDEIVLLPLALLAVTGLDLIWARDRGISWEGLASVFLCLLLAAFGWIERHGRGLRLRVPDEIWRVDRISAGED